MASPNELPAPGAPPDLGTVRLTGAGPDEPVRVGDARAEFERLTRQVPRNPEAERAFIEGKIEMVRSDPNLGDAEKERAIDQLQGQLGRK